MTQHSIASDLTGRVVLLANRLNITYWGIRIASRIARRMPLQLSYTIATAIADLAFACWRGVRVRTIENMRWVVGPSADPGRAVELARGALRNYGKYIVEFLRFPWMAHDEIARSVEIRGVEHLHAAMAQGKGAIAIGFHIGNIDLGAAVLAQIGYPVNVVVDRFDPPELDALIQRQREAKGLKLIPFDDAPRRSLRALRRNEVLALLIDKPSPPDGVVVRFFGGEIALPGGAAVLALRTGAPVVPCCVFRRPGGRFIAEVAPAVLPDRLQTGDSQRDIQTITQRLVETLEGWVRRYPDQWYPFRRMWLSSARLSP
ncbi:MAG TPA: lysophospholipid acyltransferase family protein [Chloroflexota bacterium]|nr:lysophospholipid acyltransferase family protein [Chloroflexota bacterium]